MRSLGLVLPAIICTLLGGALSSALAGQAAGTDKVPITTSSPEARDLYLKDVTWRKSCGRRTAGGSTSRRPRKTLTSRWRMSAWQTPRARPSNSSTR